MYESGTRGKSTIFCHGGVGFSTQRRVMKVKQKFENFHYFWLILSYNFIFFTEALNLKFKRNVCVSRSGGGGK